MQINKIYIHILKLGYNKTKAMMFYIQGLKSFVIIRNDG